MRFRLLKPHQTVRFTPRSVAPGCGRTLAVPGFRQTRSYSCGFTSVLMVLRYFGRHVPPAELFQRLGTGRDGTRQQAIVRELRKAKVRANVRYDVDFPRLRTEIDRDKLIIAYLDDVEHWLVVYGYGVEPERVFVADPRPSQGCEHPWESYGPRLNSFGIVCSARPASEVILDARRRPPAPEPQLPQVTPEQIRRVVQLRFDFASNTSGDSGPERGPGKGEDE